MECGPCVRNLRNAYRGIQKAERRRSPKHTEEAAVEMKLAPRWLRAEEGGLGARAGGRADEADALSGNSRGWCVYPQK